LLTKLQVLRLLIDPLDYIEAKRIVEPIPICFGDEKVRPRRVQHRNLAIEVQLGEAPEREDCPPTPRQCFEAPARPCEVFSRPVRFVLMRSSTSFFFVVMDSGSPK
jgi:hypothetical protein